MWEKYDDEFKRDAIKKVLDGQSVRSVCQELGVNESLIHKWKRAGLKIGDGQRSGVKTNFTVSDHNQSTELSTGQN